jgi:hypothetical protein
VIALGVVRPKEATAFKRDAPSCQSAIRAIAERDGRISSEHFKDTKAEKRAIWGLFKQALIPDSAKEYKCSYCERLRDRGELEVDHWRPKTMVEEWAYADWTTVSYVPATPHRRDGRPSTHGGYWWLA